MTSMNLFFSKSPLNTGHNARRVYGRGRQKGFSGSANTCNAFVKFKAGIDIVLQYYRTLNARETHLKLVMSELKQSRLSQVCVHHRWSREMVQCRMYES